MTGCLILLNLTCRNYVTEMEASHELSVVVGIIPLTVVMEVY